jgi:hypothetical protein
MSEPHFRWNIAEIEDRLNQIEGELWWTRRLQAATLFLAGLALAISLWGHG